MPLVARPVPAYDLKPGDHICFAYVNSHQNIPSRTGVLEGYFGSNREGDNWIRVWDYSLQSGPAHRSYLIKHIRNMCLIEESSEKTGISRLEGYKEMILKLVRKFSAKS